MYKKNEQETVIHYDVLTGKTTFYSNYAPDVRRYLQSDGVEITRKIEHDGVVVAVEGELTNGFTFSRRPRKRIELSEEYKQVLRERMMKLHKRGGGE